MKFQKFFDIGGCNMQKINNKNKFKLFKNKNYKKIHLFNDLGGRRNVNFSTTNSLLVNSLSFFLDFF